MNHASKMYLKSLNDWEEGRLVFTVFVGTTLLRAIINHLVFGRRGPVKGSVLTTGDRIMEEVWLGGISMALAVWSWAVFLRNEVGCSLLDTHPCIKGWPNVPLSEEIKTFLLVESGWYIHQLSRAVIGVGIPMEWDLFIHHVGTLALLALSLLKNLGVLGVLILAVFNMSSPFMHTAKIAYNLDMRRTRYILFGLFALVFFSTRVILLPLTVLKCVLFDALKENVTLFGWCYYYAGNVALHALYILQLVWMYKIVRVLWRGRTGSTPRRNVKPTPFQESESKNGYIKEVDTNGLGSEGKKND